MKYVLAILSLLMAFSVSAQLTAGSAGMTIRPGTALSVDGLALTPTAALNLTNNSIQESSTPVAGSPSSISRVYQFGTPLLFSGTAAVNYLTTELNSYGESSLQLAYAPAANSALTITTASTLDAPTHYVSNALTSKNLFIVTASALPDLSPILYTLPATQYGTTNFTLVVDLFELNTAPATGMVTMYITKDPLIKVSFNAALGFVGGKVAQNGSWTFDGVSDDDFYILTALQGVGAGGKKSVGLTGVLTPGNTRGSVTITTSIASVTGGELKITNNSDADKIDYFKK